MADPHSRPKRKRIRTFIDGFDEALDGGIPRGSVVLVAGAAGTMKSSICYNILYRNALESGIPGLYISLEQNRASIEDHMIGLGLDVEAVADTVNVWDLGIIRTSLLTGETWLDIFRKDIQEYKEKVGLDILILDSLPVLDIIVRFKDPRAELFQFFEWLRELGLTAILISEMTEGNPAYSKHEEDFLCDGIILLKMQQVDEVNVQRRLRCVKMRSARHSMNYFTLLVDGGKFQATKVIGKQQ